MRFFYVLLFLLPFASQAQLVIRIESLPKGTPDTTVLYAAGTFNNWEPNDQASVFVRSGDHWEATVFPQPGEVKYKITAGSWFMCEGTTSGGQSADRRLVYTHDTVVTIRILGWERAQSSTALDNVHVISDSFPVPQLHTYRKIVVYLPESYVSDTKQHYPVMYMHDGQNVFDAATSFSGEWGVDETLYDKEKRGNPGCIVVAVNNGGASRIDEYSPFKNARYGGGNGDAYLDFLVYTLKPYIDSVYRTKPEPKYTTIAGSSMGGLISLYGAVKFAGVFGNAGVFSPALWFNDSLFSYVSEHAKMKDSRFYFVAGKKESQTMESDINRMVVLLESKGVSSRNITEKIVENGEHTELFWHREFAPFYNWLFHRR